MGISTRGGVTNGANCRNTADAIKIKTNQNQIRFKLCNQFERAFAVVTLNEFAKAKCSTAVRAALMFRSL